MFDKFETRQGCHGFLLWLYPEKQFRSPWHAMELSLGALSHSCKCSTLNSRSTTNSSPYYSSLCISKNRTLLHSFSVHLYLGHCNSSMNILFWKNNGHNKKGVKRHCYVKSNQCLSKNRQCQKIDNVKKSTMSKKWQCQKIDNVKKMTMSKKWQCQNNDNLKKLTMSKNWQCFVQPSWCLPMLGKFGTKQRCPGFLLWRHGEKEIRSPWHALEPSLGGFSHSCKCSTQNCKNTTTLFIWLFIPQHLK